MRGHRPAEPDIFVHITIEEVEKEVGAVGGSMARQSGGLNLPIRQLPSLEGLMLGIQSDSFACSVSQ